MKQACSYKARIRAHRHRVTLGSGSGEACALLAMMSVVPPGGKPTNMRAVLTSARATSYGAGPIAPTAKAAAETVSK
jgi:hypothetical protein